MKIDCNQHFSEGYSKSMQTNTDCLQMN